MKLPIKRKVFDVAGEGQENKDGSFRQDIIRKCYPGDLVSLVREPKNPYDKNAIRIDFKNQTIGYINKQDAVLLSAILDEQRDHVAIIHRLTGGVPDYPNYGVKVSIAWDGRSSHPYIDLDNEQENYRAKTEKSGGCLGVIVFFVAMLLVASFTNNLSA